MNPQPNRHEILPWNASFLLLPATGPLTADEVFIIHGSPTRYALQLHHLVTSLGKDWERLGNTMVSQSFPYLITSPFRIPQLLPGHSAHAQRRNDLASARTRRAMASQATGWGTWSQDGSGPGTMKIQLRSAKLLRL